MPIKSFADTTTADIFNGLNTKAARVIPQRVWNVACARLDALHAATNLMTLCRPGYRLEPLKWSKPGFHSIRVNDRYRVTFRFYAGDAYDVKIEDYH